MNVLPNFLFVPFSLIFISSCWIGSLWELLAFTLEPAIGLEIDGLAWELEFIEAFAEDPGINMGCEIFRLTEGIRSSGFDWCWFLEEPSFLWMGLVDLRSILTDFFPSSEELLDDAPFVWPRRRANLDSESCNFFSASSSYTHLSKTYN